jgi:glycolate oxidase
MMAAFDSVSQAANTVGAIFAQGIIPAGLEMMDRLAIQAAEDFVKAGYPRQAEAMLLIELDGTVCEVDELIEQTEQVLAQQGANGTTVERSPEGRARLWLGRKAAFPAVGRIAPDYYCMDGTIPRRHLAEVLERINERSRHYGLQVANVFHAGDGTLHPLILYDANVPGQLDKAEAFGADILNLCIEFGGTITGEHGVGLEKINQMCVQFDESELRLFHGIKAAFDPSNLLNPGKAVPTLSRCAEFGAMHVHAGQLPHADLDRF